VSAVLSPRSAMTCRASSLVVIGPGASPSASKASRGSDRHAMPGALRSLALSLTQIFRNLRR
jgi:hypothetical protein